MECVGKEYALMVVSDHCWGKGNTMIEALDRLRAASGGRRGNPKLYLTYLVDPAATVDDMGGIVTPHDGKQPILVMAMKNAKPLNPATV